MTNIASITLDVADTAAASRFYKAAFGLDSQVQVRAANAPSTGFRAYTLSLTTAQPATVMSLFQSAVDGGASVLKPVAKSMWGHSGVVRAPDGAIWKMATSAKKDTGPDTGEIEKIVLLLGVSDVAATKKFYVDHGLTVAKSFGTKYVEFALPDSPILLALYKYKALAKDAGVPAEGSGSHRLTINSDAGTFTDPDAFAWQSV
jgi:predicted lactoylglutathione lyase